MRRYFTVLLLAMLVTSSMMVMAQDVSCQELPRTRTIPYPSAELAAERDLAKQRYMEPIAEWESLDDGSFEGVFTYPFSWIDRRIYLRVEGMMQPYEVLINDKSAGSATNGHVAVEFDITKIAKEDKNRVVLRPVNKEDGAAIECFDSSASQPAVYVISQPRVRVRDIYWNATRGMGDIVNVDFGVVMRNETLNPKMSRLHYELYVNDTVRLAGGRLDVKLDMHGVDTMRFGATLNDSLLWHHSSPTQLSLRLENRIENRKSEVYDLAVALRELRYEDEVFYINGTATPMEWHVMSPMSDVAAVERAHAEGYYAIRFSAGFVNDEVLTYCDNAGIYVALTAPINSSLSGESRKRGGNPSNDPRMRDEYVERVVSLVETTDRHASVVAYYMADDSANGICLYEAYLAMKRVAGARPVLYDDGGNEWNSD